MRCPVPGDIPWIVAARSDRGMSRYIPGIPFPYSQSDARTFLEDTDRGWAEGSGAAFVVSHAVGHAVALAQRPPGLQLLRAHPLTVIQVVHVAVERRLPAWPEELHGQDLLPRPRGE